MTNYTRINSQAHLFHLVSPSLWPFFTCITLLSLITYRVFNYVLLPPKSHVFINISLKSSITSTFLGIYDTGADYKIILDFSGYFPIIKGNVPYINFPWTSLDTSLIYENLFNHSAIDTTILNNNNNNNYNIPTIFFENTRPLSNYSYNNATYSVLTINNSYLNNYNILAPICIWFINHKSYIALLFTPLISLMLSNIRSHASYTNSNDNNNTYSSWFSSYIPNYFTKASNTQTSVTSGGNGDGNEDDDWNKKFEKDSLEKLDKNQLLELYNEILGYYQLTLESIRASIDYSRTHGLSTNVLEGIRVNIEYLNTNRSRLDLIRIASDDINDPELNRHLNAEFLIIMSPQDFVLFGDNSGLLVEIVWENKNLFGGL